MAGRVKCPRCRTACQFLGPSIAIPPKRELTNWRRLEEDVKQFRQDEAARRKKVAVRKKHNLEHRILNLKNRPSSSGRNKLVKELEKKLTGA